jgi:uncharacterized protein with FMN-binding domain
MKKLLVIGGVIVILIGYVVFQRHESEEKPVVLPSNPQPTTNQATSTGAATPTAATAAAGYKDGSYTGTAIDTPEGYGAVQVKAVIQGGKITDIQFVQYPDHPGHTLEVSQVALPALKQEAITAQSSNVSMVSGATQTSDAFSQSLQSALDQAKS